MCFKLCFIFQKYGKNLFLWAYAGRNIQQKKQSNSESHAAGHIKMWPCISETNSETPVADGALVPVDTLVWRFVVGISGFTLAPETPHCVHARAVLAHSCKIKQYSV